jgi:hypothetical protein
VTKYKLRRWYSEALTAYRAGVEQALHGTAPAGIAHTKTAAVAYARGVKDGEAEAKSGALERGDWGELILPRDLWLEVLARKTAQIARHP